MTNNLAIIKHVIEEHKVIRGHIKLMGDTVADLEALSSLERAHADWVAKPISPTTQVDLTTACPVLLTA